MAEAAGEHYVVTHTGVDKWKQGDLVARKDLKGETTTRTGETATYDSFDRLLSLGAIRPATADEVKAGKGTVAPGFVTLSPAVQAELAAQEAEIEKLRRFVGDQQDKLASFERLGLAAAPQQSAAADPALKVIVEQRAAEIEALKARAQANEERLKKIGSQTPAQQKETTEAKSGSGTAPPPAPAPPSPPSPPADPKGRK